jgi:uncharacterized protein
MAYANPLSPSGPYAFRSGIDPLILLVPGLGNSGPGHWQSAWERDLRMAQRVDLGSWDDPRRNLWVNKLNLAIRRADRPVVLVAHSLGCLAVAWWAEWEAAEEEHNVVGALLVAPPEVEERDVDPRLARFAPVPVQAFPFPSIVAASRNDPYVRFGRARKLAEGWGSRFADAGEIGHINAESDIGDWGFGRFLLHQLLGRPAPLAACPAAARTPRMVGLAPAQLAATERA